jgi:hypothetical protein
MAEFRLGRLKFNWRGAWTTSTAYVIDDVVQVGGNVYVCVINHTSASTEDNWYSNDFNIGSPRWELMVPGVDSVGDWTGSATYFGPNDVVKYGGVLYRTITPNVGTAFTNSYYVPYVEGYGNVSPFSTTTNYKLRDVVKSNGSAYVASTAISASETTPAGNSDWDLLVSGISTSGVSTYADGVLYDQGTVVTYGGNSYIAIGTTVQDVKPDGDADTASNWSLLVNGLRNAGTWSGGSTYHRGDVVRYTTSSYVAISTITTNNQPDISAGQWGILAQGDTAAVLSQRGDLLTRDSSAAVRLGIGSEGTVLKSNGSDPLWGYFGQQTQNYYVGPSGDNANDGSTPETAWRTIGYAMTNITTPATVEVFAGTYAEQLPITVPKHTDIIGASQRQVFVQPANAGLGTTTMFFLSDSTILENLTMRGMCGYAKTNGLSNSILGVDPGAVGCYVKLNPTDSILRKSPYIKNCSCLSGPSISNRIGFAPNGSAIGAYVDGNVHAGFGATVGNQSIVMDAYTMINDEGIGVWVDNLGKAEIVSVFTYFCDFGYTAMDGGIIRALNGNNSYGHFALNAFGSSPTETPITGHSRGDQLLFQNGSLKGSTISLGSSITGSSSGAVGYILNEQTEQDDPFVIYEYDYIGYGFTTFEQGELVTIGTGTTALLLNNSDYEGGLKGFLFPVAGLTTTPDPRGVIQFLDTQYSGLGSEGRSTYGFGKTDISSYTGFGTDTGAYTISAVTDYVHGTFGVVGTYNTTQSALGAQGSYTNVVTTSNGSGTSAQFDITINASGQVTSIDTAQEGTGYDEGEMLTVDGANIGGLAGAAITFAAYPRYGTALIKTANEKIKKAAHFQDVRILYDYSQVRVTGHDFLNIGIGGTVDSNYPGKPTSDPIEGNQVNETAPGRVFFVTSDQDGNFRVGTYFKVDQATGAATLNASAFNLSGLTELRLGAIGGQIGATINEFSTDVLLSGNSDLSVPTERAVKTYIDTANNAQDVQLKNNTYFLSGR